MPQTNPHDDAPLHRLLNALPGPVRRGYARLRQPGRGVVRQAQARTAGNAR